MSVIRSVCEGTARSIASHSGCDFESLLEPTAKLVGSVDLAVCHLEVPIVSIGKRISGYPTFGAPPSLASALAATGWDHCSTASNHTIDRGTAGTASTLSALDRAGITHVGSYRTELDAQSVFIREVNGIKVAHIAATHGLNGLVLPKGQQWWVQRISVAQLLARASMARQRGADAVILSLHWGVEYQHAPTADQQRIARALTESPDIDLVVGHHAHVVQPVQQVNGKWVVYGMGNHVSGQIPTGRKIATQDGLLVEVTLDLDGGRLAINQPIVHATWNSAGSHKVFLVNDLAGRGGSAASCARTRRVVNPALLAEGYCR